LKYFVLTLFSPSHFNPGKLLVFPFPPNSQPT
jgi:hypothetical protein